MQQKYFDVLIGKIPTLMSLSELDRWKLQIETALMGANGGAAMAEHWPPKTSDKQQLADLISNGMKDYRRGARHRHDCTRLEREVSQ
jgi:hypothetical protein